MRHYRIFHAPILAFFSTAFYRDVGLRWKGTGFAYLLLLLAISWIPSFMEFQISFADYVANKAPSIISQIPPIRIFKGEASTDVPQPHKIVIPETGAILVLVDTTGQTKSLEDAKARILLTKTEVLFQKNDTVTESFSLKKVTDLTVDQQAVTRWLKILRNYSAVVFFPFVVLGEFAFRVAQLLVYAAIGLLFARFCKTSQPYGTLLRLAVMAITPVIIVGTVCGIAGIVLPAQTLLFIVTTMVYLFIAIKTVANQQNARILDDVGNPQKKS